jgi:hypothetical protein
MISKSDNIHFSLFILHPLNFTMYLLAVWLGSSLSRLGRSETTIKKAAQAAYTHRTNDYSLLQSLLCQGLSLLEKLLPRLPLLVLSGLDTQQSHTASLFTLLSLG